ncbi:Aspartic proteinase CDR1 [Linum perenne]
MVLLWLCFITNSEAAAGGGFSVQLIHRDSPISPFYNPHLSPSQRIQNALKRSFNRLHHYSPILAAQSEVTANNGEYLMSISLGTPPVPILAIADTGSDVVWTQCKPCPSCYVQNDPLFDPASSSTYQTVPCSSKACSSLNNEGAFCAENDTVCHYQVGYGDQSHTDGDLAVETLTLGSTDGQRVLFPKTLIGCGHNNAGTFSANGSGIVGLGGGSASLVTQIGSSIGYKFSYCLVKLGEDKLTSTMSFGENAVVSGVSTPLISDPTKPTFYFLNLEGVSVGEKRIPFQVGSSSFGSSDGKGNIIIDSGTTLTILPAVLVSQLSEAVESQIVGGKKAEDPQGDLSLCYVAPTTGTSLGVPRIIFHFQGADVELPSSNVFIQVSGTVTCFAFYGSDDATIYGNVAQQNFLVGYDIQKKTLSFKPTDCARN